MFDFSGKVAIVTGGASGIGLCTARQFAALGAATAIFDKNEPEGAGQEENLSFFHTDVIKEDIIHNSVTRVLEEWGRIDFLVCAAGVTYPYKSVEESNLAGWERTLNINSRGVFFCNQAVFPVMKKQSAGRIVNIASVAAKTGGGLLGNAIYGASKAAVVSFSKGLAREAGPFNVTVNVICPGVIDTPMSGGLTQESRDRLIAATPLGKFGIPEDIMNAVVFLCSDSARHITSANLNVDGGFMRGN